MRVVDTGDSTYMIGTGLSRGTAYASPPRHLHNEFEILMVHSGGVIVSGEGWFEVVTSGEAILFEGHTIHGTRPLLGQYLRTVCVFDTEVVDPAVTESLLPNPGPRVASFDRAAWTRLTHSLKALGDSSMENSACDRGSRLLLSFLERFDEASSRPRRPCLPPIVRDLLSYMVVNVNSRMTVGELASKFYVSNRHLRYLFRKYLGCSPHWMWTVLRIEHAISLLNSATRLSDLAELAGFDSRRGFEMAFRNVWGRSPRVYLDELKRVKPVRFLRRQP